MELTAFENYNILRNLRMRNFLIILNYNWINQEKLNESFFLEKKLFFV